MRLDNYKFHLFFKEKYTFLVYVKPDNTLIPPTTTIISGKYSLSNDEILH